MKILVTGGAGFIGGNFVHYMVEKYPEDTTKPSAQRISKHSDTFRNITD